MTDILVQLKKKDKKNGIALLYKQYGKKLYGYSVSKWNISEDDTWEIVYKTLYKVMDVIDKYTFENEDKFAGFVFKIFVNYLRNRYRDNKSKQIDTIELNENYNTIASDINEKEDEIPKLSPLMECLQKVLQTMEDWQRIVLLMRAQNYSYESIVHYVNKPESQLKVYHMRLKKRVTEKTNECVENTVK